PDCSVAGVLGPLCGSIGSAMAMEAIKMLTGIGTPLVNAVAVHSSLDAGWETIPVSPIPGRERVTDLKAHLVDYAQHTFGTESEQADGDGLRCEAHGLGPAALDWSQLGPEAILVDVRDDDEISAGTVPGAIHIPMAELLDDPSRLPRPDAANAADGVGVALYCRAGIRSARAAAQPPANGGSTSTVSPALSAADRSVAATELTRKLDRESTVAACGSASSARAETSSSTDPARMCDSRAPKASRAAAKNRTVMVGIYPPMALMGRWGCSKSSVPMP